MTGDVQKLLDTFADLREKADVNACFGDPVQVEGRTVIPVAKVSYGFGMGAEQGPGSDAAGSTDRARGPYGGGVKSSPLGIIEITGERVRIEPVIDEQKVVILSVLVGAWCLFWLTRVWMAVSGKRE